MQIVLDISAEDPDQSVALSYTTGTDYFVLEITSGGLFRGVPSTPVS